MELFSIRIQRTFQLVSTLDNNGANENFCKMPIDAFFDEEAIEDLNSED